MLIRHHSELSNRDFEKQFADGTLRPRLFNHEAHIRLAWIHLTNYGPLQAIENLTRQIRAFADRHGVSNNYHETITVASIRAVYHFVLQSDTGNFKNFIMEFPRLTNDFKALLSSHYSIDIFKSEEARRQYIEPDLIPFDPLIPEHN